MQDFDKKMDDFLFKKKGQQDDIVTSQLLDPKSATKEESSEDFVNVINNDQIMDQRFSD